MLTRRDDGPYTLSADHVGSAGARLPVGGFGGSSLTVRENSAERQRGERQTISQYEMKGLGAEQSGPWTSASVESSFAFWTFHDEQKTYARCHFLPKFLEKKILEH